VDIEDESGDDDMEYEPAEETTEDDLGESELDDIEYHGNIYHYAAADLLNDV